MRRQLLNFSCVIWTNNLCLSRISHSPSRIVLGKYPTGLEPPIKTGGGYWHLIIGFFPFVLLATDCCRYMTKYQSQYGAGGTQYSYYYEEDDSTFQLVRIEIYPGTIHILDRWTPPAKRSPCMVVDAASEGVAGSAVGGTTSTTGTSRPPPTPCKLSPRRRRSRRGTGSGRCASGRSSRRVGRTTTGLPRSSPGRPR